MSNKQNDITERTSVIESGMQHLPEAACADLSALPSVGIARAEWDGRPRGTSSWMFAMEHPKQVGLLLIALSQAARRTWLTTPNTICIPEMAGSTRQLTSIARTAWPLSTLALPKKPTRMIFGGDGRSQLTFGGISLVPLEHSEILHARTSATLQHFILTKFGFGVQNENWYDGVLSLFEAVTYPSLCAQTSQKFTWLIVVDAQIPGLALSRLRHIVGGARNIHIVPLDLTDLRHVRHGCFDFIWDRCQDYIIEHRLLTKPSEYVVTSAIDSDDALHRNTVELVNQHSAPELARLVANESSRPTVICHTCGQVLTFPNGLRWYAEADVVQPLKSEFQGMAVFVLARFSSGISVLSCDHSEWSAIARALKFDVKKVQLDRPMWVYVRHERTQIKWQMEVPESDSSCIEILHRFRHRFCQGGGMACQRRSTADAGPASQTRWTFRPRTA